MCVPRRQGHPEGSPEPGHVVWLAGGELPVGTDGGTVSAEHGGCVSRRVGGYLDQAHVRRGLAELEHQGGVQGTGFVARRVESCDHGVLAEQGLAVDGPPVLVDQVEVWDRRQPPRQLLQPQIDVADAGVHATAYDLAAVNGKQQWLHLARLHCEGRRDGVAADLDRVSTGPSLSLTAVFVSGAFGASPPTVTLLTPSSTGVGARWSPALDVRRTMAVPDATGRGVRTKTSTASTPRAPANKESSLSRSRANRVYGAKEGKLIGFPGGRDGSRLGQIGGTT